jgi:hypothetical protein
MKVRIAGHNSGYDFRRRNAFAATELPYARAYAAVGGEVFR